MASDERFHRLLRSLSWLSVDASAALMGLFLPDYSSFFQPNNIINYENAVSCFLFFR